MALTECQDPGIRSSSCPVNLVREELAREEGRQTRHFHKTVPILKGRENEFSSKGRRRNSIKRDNTDDRHHDSIYAKLHS